MCIKQRTIKKLRKAADGVVSILLIIALLPFLSLAAAFIEAERYQNAIKALDEALGSSALSTLSQYDSYLLDRFGLLAVKQTDDEDFMETQVNKYLQRQQTVDMYGAGKDTLTAEVEGAYPLADIAVLRQQVLSYSNVLVPAKIITEFGELETLIKELEKCLFGNLTSIFGQVKSGADMLNKEVAMIDAVEDAKKEMKKVSNTVVEHDKYFNAFESAMNALNSHYNSPIPDDEEGAEEWQEKLKSLQEEAEKARDDYTKSIDDVTKQLDALEKQMAAVTKAQKDFETSAGSFALGSLQAYDAIEADSTKDEQEKAALKNAMAVESGVDKTAQGIGNKLDEVIKNGLNPESFENAYVGLDSRKKAVEESNVTSGYFGSESAQYHYGDLDKFRDANNLNELLQEMEDEEKNSSWLSMLLATFDLIDELFATDLFFNPQLSVTLDTEYYKSTYGGLPGQKDRNSSLYSLASSHETEDEERSKGYLEKIDPDYDPDDPYGFYAGSTASKLEKLIEAIEKLIEYGDRLEDASWFREKIKTFANCVEQLGIVIDRFEDFRKDIFSNMVQKLYERMLIMGYMSYNLPNRVNYKTGATLTGYRYSNAALAPSALGTSVSLGVGLVSIADIMALLTPNKNYAFSGAELEYILCGYNSEIANQSMVFLELWIMRALLDIFPIVCNSEVQGIVEGLSATVVGSVVAVVYLVLIMLAEPLLDTYVLVNGGDIRFIKGSNEIFLTTTGLDDLMKAISKITFLSPSKQNKVIDLSKKATGDTKKSPVNGWVTSLGKFDYPQHVLILMLLTGNESAYLKRLTNIIQTEGTYRNRTSGATGSQHALGTYTDFDVEKAYTSMRIEADGTLKNFLPIPSVLNPSGTSVFNTPFSYNRILYRGY